MIINSILEVLEDGRFVVVYDDGKILTMTCPLPNNLESFDTPEKLFLAGVAHVRLMGSPTSKVRVYESEEL